MEQQIDLFGNSSSPSSFKVNNGLNTIRNGEYLYYASFFSTIESNTYLKSLKDNIFWKQESMNIDGKKINFPRLTAWYGDSDKPYTFSGLTLNPHPWTSDLLTIRKKIGPLAEVMFNSVYN